MLLEARMRNRFLSAPICTADSGQRSETMNRYGIRRSTLAVMPINPSKSGGDSTINASGRGRNRETAEAKTANERCATIRLKKPRFAAAYDHTRYMVSPSLLWRQNNLRRHSGETIPDG